MILECGCRVTYEPCEHHLEQCVQNDETPHLELSFKGKYSDWPENKHRVDLERVQRIHLGIDQEPMEFSEESLAQMLQALADDRPTDHSAFVLHALARALRGEDDNHRLVLKQAKRGKWNSPSDEFALRRQSLAWRLRLERLRNEGWQTEAAIHRIAETTGNSVSTVYARISAEKDYQSDMQSFVKSLAKFKRSLNSRKTK